MRQYALDMHLPVAYAPEQFMLAESNNIAHAWITRWPDWPSHALYIAGEEGAGKTHLAHIWKEKSGAIFLVPGDTALPAQAAIADGIEQFDAEFLFHLFNHTKTQHIPLLLIANTAPEQLPFTLPDLLSRLKTLPVAVIDAPDDTLLEAVLAKHFADRQLKVTPEIIAYMLPRLPRSFSAIAEAVARLDNDALESGRNLTLPFIRQTLNW